MATQTEPRSFASTPGRALFRRAAWGVLGYNVFIVVWGAFVRASGSGNGCGDHWPACNGAIIPPSPTLQTIIEFTHRVSSGVSLLAVAGLCLWAFRTFPRAHPVRRAASLSMFFLIVEALLGAGLVLLKYVGADQSIGRGFYLAAHLANTLLLLAALTATAWLAARPNVPVSWRPITVALRVSLALALLVGVTGAIAALGDTLFPASSLAAGLHQDFAPAAHFLIRLRLAHPALAILSSAFFAYAAYTLVRSHPASSAAVLILVFVQLCAGALNVALLAPVWMQLLHLFLADALWIALVYLSLETTRSVTVSR